MLRHLGLFHTLSLTLWQGLAFQAQQFYPLEGVFLTDDVLQLLFVLFLPALLLKKP